MAHQKVTSDFPTAELPQIGAGKVDVIVVYKLDRLARSLSDFAKLVDREPAFNVSDTNSRYVFVLGE
jgi:hypothetical protein